MKNYEPQTTNHKLKWDPYKSKIAAAIKKGINIDLKKTDYVLYLGASTGSTVSHLAKKCKGIFAVEISPVVIKSLVFLAEENKNIIPILENANHPEKYKDVFCEWLFQDIAQKNQVEIFLKNFKMFKPRTGVLVIKARNIDATKKPEKIFEKCREELKEVKIIEGKSLEPYQKDHMMFVVQVLGKTGLKKL